MFICTLKKRKRKENNSAMKYGGGRGQLILKTN